MSEAFFHIFRGLPRYAPGSEAATREALRRLGPLPPRPRVIDLGCGNGASTLVLARELEGPPIVAVDLHRPFLDELEVAAARARLAHRVHPRCTDFGALTDPPGSYDLLWCEGAIYHLGIAAGLRRWRPLLAPGGRAAISELVWLVDAPPPAAAAFWREDYPAMTTDAGTRAAIAAAGWSVDDAFVLPPPAWEAYYAPLAARLDQLSPGADDALRAAIAAIRREIDVRAAHASTFGYVFYLLRPE